MAVATKKLVKDYKGNLVPRDQCRKIKTGDGYKYYVENVSCFLMEDGQWYRIDSPKLGYDHYKQKHVLLSVTDLITGIINTKGEQGTFSEHEGTIYIAEVKGGHSVPCMNEEIAIKLGYEECISDGIFYKSSNLTPHCRKTWFTRKDIPKSERSSSYNLEQDPEKKNELIKMYQNSDFPITVAAKRIARYLGDFTIGMEVEVINGFIPKRIRNKYGLKALKDGSLRSDNGEGIEYVTMPMSGAKAVQTIINTMREFSKRCVINNYCSLHYHFGNVRKDKIYVLSLYKLISHVQMDLIKYFPYSRFNSIKADGKVYCKALENLNIDYKRILSCKTEDNFKAVVVDEFNKLYKWLNGGKGLAEKFADDSVHREVKEIDGKKMFCDVWLRNVYSTKIVQHALQGQKWDKPVRYYIVNFLNLFFNSIGTVEFRCHESTTNPEKAIIWLLVCSAILKYAEDINTVFYSGKITLEDVISAQFPEDMVTYILEYFKLRNQTFFDRGFYRQNWQNIESNWFADDPNFKFQPKNKYFKLI